MTGEDMEPRMTLRTYLVLVAMRDASVTMSVAMEAVDATAAEHPTWNLDEERTYTQWRNWETH